MFTSIADLIQRTKGQVEIACDTEFEELRTLTVQFAARIGDDIAVQVYSSPAIPPMPPAERLKALLPREVDPPGGRIVIREAKPLDEHLSPVRVLSDLYQIRGVEPVGRLAGDGKVAKLDPLTVTFVAHYWPADFLRVFGQEFFTGLINYQVERGGQLVIQAHKLLAFKEAHEGHRRFCDPVLEYAKQSGVLHPIKVKTFDTCLAFGPSSLDGHAATFLGVQKLKGLSQRDKRGMQGAFHRKPVVAYAYAVLDAVLTLRVKERMAEADERMYRDLGFADRDVPPLRPTLGSRVSEMITKAVANTADGSVLLSRTGKPLAGGGAGTVSANKVKRLMEKGSGGFIAAERVSMFGKQTGETHGGLLFSRSPTKFFHPAPGQLRDVDLSGCYAHVIGGMSLYVGRPVVHEPGTGRMKLRDAVAFAQEHAAGPDAWVVKVSGPITAAPNALVPSTADALTHANYQSRKDKKRAKSRRFGFTFDWMYEAGKPSQSTVIYTDVVEAGVVAWPTWLMIQALPPEVRRQYEELEVETLLLYPRDMVADSGPAYDALVKKFHRLNVPWEESLDLAGFQQVVRRFLDQDYVSLRFDIGRLARQISQCRKRAKQEFGDKSGAQLALKLQANSMYGVAASRHLVTNNVVCANYITATARALAFALQMSLNGFQVITDGCTYRRDQIPAVPFAECLKHHPEYPIRRAEGGVPFRDPGGVPEDGVAFTAWYREHVKWFFGAAGPEYDKLFGLHDLEHKATGDLGTLAFDGLCCDGSGNYMKLVRDGDGWKAVEFKARGYKTAAKRVLKPWIVQAYTTDTYEMPPPVTKSPTLLTYKDANRFTRKALEVLEAGRSPEEAKERPVLVYYPLGLELPRVQAYKVIKPSGFLFKTPHQRGQFLKALDKFSDGCGCGLEVLALRRSGGGRERGSIVGVAEVLYKLIRASETNPTRALNLTRTFAGLERVRRTHHRRLRRLKDRVKAERIRSINEAILTDEECLTGMFMQKIDVIRVE